MEGVHRETESEQRARGIDELCHLLKGHPDGWPVPHSPQLGALLNEVIHGRAFSEHASPEATLETWGNWHAVRDALTRLPAKARIHMALTYGLWGPPLSADDAARCATIDLSYSQQPAANDPYEDQSNWMGRVVALMGQQLGSEGFGPREFTGYVLRRLHYALDGQSLITGSGTVIRVKQWSCSCGRYAGREYRGVVCDVCRTENFGLQEGEGIADLDRMFNT